MIKGKNTMSKEVEMNLERMGTSDLKAMLDEVASYRHTGDMQGKSPLVQVLLKQAEESESGEESIKHTSKRQKAKKPKERRRRKESDSLAARTHAGGSLDNIAGDKAARKSAKHKGVAGRTREGGSCCNLSRGSFETNVGRRRRRRDPHRQHGGSLEDLSAIEETGAGAGRAKSSVSESSKHGGSLQNINQEAGAVGGAVGGTAGDFLSQTATTTVSYSLPLATAIPSYSSQVVIEIDADDGAGDGRVDGGGGGGTLGPRGAALALGQPCSEPYPPDTGTSLRELPAGPRLPSLEEAGGRILSSLSNSTGHSHSNSTADGPQRADATVNFPLRLESSVSSYSKPPYDHPTDTGRVARHANAILAGADPGCTQEDIADMPPAEHVGMRRMLGSQVLDTNGSGTAATTARLVNGQQPRNNGSNSSNNRTADATDKLRKKNKKKEEPEILTQTVDGYRGDEQDVDNLISFIESGGDKKRVDDKNGKRPDKSGKKETKGRRNGGRPSDEAGDRSGRGGGGASGADRRSGKKSGGKQGSGRSSSLEARSAPGGRPANDGSSVFCGDLAKPNLKKSDACAAAAAAVSARGRSPAAAGAAPASEAGPGPDRPTEPPEPAGPDSGPVAQQVNVQEMDGCTYVTAPAIDEPGGGFKRDFYSVTTDSTHIEESEFHVVTRRQRRRPAGGGGGYPAGAAGCSQGRPHKAASLDEWRSDRPRRYIPGLGRNTSSAPHSELSDTESEPAGSPPPTAVVEADPGGDDPPPLPPPAPPADSPSSSSSWAQVAKHTQRMASPPRAARKTRDAGTSTDFIDGVGPIFGDCASPKARGAGGGAGPAGRAPEAPFVRGASEPLDLRIGGVHPDEFPAMAPPPSTAGLAAHSPRQTGSSPRTPDPESDCAVRRSSGPLDMVTRRPLSADDLPLQSCSGPARRHRKGPAVIIREGALSDDDPPPGGTNPHVYDIRFGYIDGLADPDSVVSACAAAETALSGVELFCRRFRAPRVDVSRFNWREIVVFLNKVYTEAASKPGVFFEDNGHSLSPSSRQ